MGLPPKNYLKRVSPCVKPFFLTYNVYLRKKKNNKVQKKKGEGRREKKKDYLRYKISNLNPWKEEE